MFNLETNIGNHFRVSRELGPGNQQHLTVDLATHLMSFISSEQKTDAGDWEGHQI